MQSLPMAYSGITGRRDQHPGWGQGWFKVGVPVPLTLLVAQLLVLGLLASLQLVGVGIDGVKDGLGDLLLPALRDGEWEVAVQLLVALQQLGRVGCRGEGLQDTPRPQARPLCPVP